MVTFNSEIQYILLLLPCFLGYDYSPEGGAVRLSGNGYSWTDEKHGPVRCLRDQGIHQGEWNGLFAVEVTEGLHCPLLGNWQNVLVFFLLHPEQNLNCVYVSCIRRKKDLYLFQGLGTDEETLIEILCSRSNDELVTIKKVYMESKSKISQTFSWRAWNVF